MSEVIDHFKGEFDWLSNFHNCPVHFEGLTFGNTEAAFQAAKTLDMEEREKFLGILWHMTGCSWVVMILCVYQRCQK